MKKEKGKMKKVLAIFLSIVTICTGLPLTSLGSEKDKVFDKFSSWTFESKSKDDFTPAEGHTGNGASVVKKGKGEATLTSNLIVVNAGKKYKAGVWMKFPTGAASLSVTAYEDAEGKKQVDDTIVIGQLESAVDFTEIAGDYVIPKGAGYIKLAITMGNGQSLAGEAYTVDDAYLYAYSSAISLSDGYKTDQAWYRNGWVNGGSTTRYVNVVENGCKDDGALYFHNTTPEGDMPVCIAMGNINPGDYTLSLYIKGRTAVTEQFKFLQAGHDADCVVITDKGEYADWTKVEKDFKVFDDPKVFYLFFGQYSHATDIYVDNISLIEKATGVDVLEGTGDFYNSDGHSLTTENLVVNAGFEDVLYKYLPISEFDGTFENVEVVREEMGWSLNDNNSKDILSLENGDGVHGKVVSVTKGVDAQDGQGWVTLSSPLLNIEEGASYKLSFDIKAEGENPYYITSGYWFDAKGNPIKDFKSTEGTPATVWENKTAELVVPAGAANVQIRIVCQGAANTKLYFDNFVLNPKEMEPQWELENWNYPGMYNNPNEAGVSQIRLEDEGYLDPGSLHFVQDYSKCAGTGKSIEISQLVKAWEQKTYIFSAWIKGNTKNAGDPSKLELVWGNGAWLDTGNAWRDLDVNSETWTKVEYEFNVTHPEWFPIHIYSSQYTGADFYIDNISIYAKDDVTKKNLITGGDFCKTSDKVNTLVNLFENGGFENLEKLIVSGWTVAGNASYIEDEKAVVLEKGASLTSYRYEVKAGDVYQYNCEERDGKITFVFDEGLSYTAPAAKGYIEVPEKAAYMRVIYSADEQQARIYNITLTEYDEKTNFNFDVPKFGGKEPYHWTGYHVNNPQNGQDYAMSWEADGGINSSGAMKVSALRNSENNYVVYSTRVKVEPSKVYSLNFWGKYKGSDVVASPLIRMYKEDGSETTEMSSYNWCQDGLAKDNSGEWKFHSTNFATSSDTTYIEVRFEMSGRHQGDEFFFDEITLKMLGAQDDPNLDFEAGVPGAGILNWTGYNAHDLEAQDYEMSLAEGEGPDGSNAMQVTAVRDNKGSYVVYSIRRALEPSVVYNLTFDGKYKGDAIGVAPLIRMYKEDGSETTEASSYNWCYDPLSRDNSNTWKKHAMNFTTSSDMAVIEIRFEIAGPKAGDTAWIDNIELKKVGSSDDLNFDFEIGADVAGVFGWMGYQVANLSAKDYEMSIAKGQGVDGSNAMLVRTVKENKNSYVVYSGRMKAEPSSVYSMTFRGNYKGENLKCAPLIRQYKADGTDTTEASSYVWLNGVSSTDNSNTWKTYSANFSTSKDTAYIEVRFEVSGPRVGTEFLFDQIKVEKIGDATNANLDFETGENGKAVFNWSTYERRELLGKEEEGNFGGYTSYKADKASGDGSAAAVIKKLNTENIEYYFKSTILEVSPDTDYTFEYDVMVQNAKKNAVMVYIRQYKNAIGEGVKNESEAHLWLTNAYSYGSCSWKRTGSTFRTAKDASYISVFFVCKGAEQSTVFLDNVTLTKTKEVTDPNLDFEYVAAGKPVNWSSTTADGVAEISASSDVYYRGNKSLHLVKKYSAINYTTMTMQKKIKVHAGDSVEFVIHMRSKDAVSGRIAAVIQGYDNAGNVVEANHGQERVLNTTSKLSEWDDYSITYKVSKNVTQLTLSLRVGGREADVYFDAIDFYNYTQNGNTIYAEDFAGPDSDGMFGGWKAEKAEGSPSFGTKGEASITGKNRDNGSVYTDVDVLCTDYTYSFKTDYHSKGNVTGRIMVDAIDWRGRTTTSVVTQEIQGDTSSSIETSFSAVSATLYRIRLEKTGGNGTISMDNIKIQQIAEPAKSVGWEGRWIVHPEDYDTILSQTHNERYYYYRQEFYLEEDVKTAQIQITADDKYKLYVNGMEVYEETASGDTWSMPGMFDLTEYLQKGKNVIAVRLYNNVYAYGLLYDGIIKMENDSSLRFYSDESLMIAREHKGWSEKDAEQFMLPEYDIASCKAWTKAQEYCVVGEGAWGIIAFDNAEYSDYKIESNEFNFPKETVDAGDKLKVRAKLKIEEALPESNEFEIFFWKKNTTKKICKGTLILANGKSTADWPIGKEFEAEFELKIPEFLPTGSYSIQFDDIVAIVSDYYVGNKVGSIKVSQPNTGVTTKSEIKLENGKPVYYLNGIPTTSLWYGRPENDTAYREETVTKAGEAGLETIICYVCLSGTYGQIWMEDGSIDTTPIDQQILGTLSANPEAYLQVAIDTTPPNWWLEQNPEECVKLSNGKLSKQTYASKKWRQECGEIMKKVLDYLMSQPYANNIAGIKLTGGTTYEWQWWGMNGSTEVGDFSSAGLLAFREWLRETYGTDAALQRSWRNSGVTLDTAEVPTIEARSQSEYRTILSVQDSRAVIDYQRFMTDMQTDSILYYADLVKQHLNDRLVVGTYAGYLQNCITYEFATTTAHGGLDRILRSESIDWIQTPWLYGEREIGNMTDYMGAIDSVTAHGKLLVVEEDSRLNLNYLALAQDSRVSVGWTRTTQESVEVLKRNFCYVLSKGQSLDFYDLGGGYFDDDQIYGVMSQMSQESTLSLGLERESTSDVAVFMDAAMSHYFKYSKGDLTDELLYKSVLNKQREELQNIGTPYDIYLLDDLVDGMVPEHKINIMLGTTQITDIEREAIERQLKKDGNIILWIFLTGITDGNTTDVSLMSDVVGMHLKMLDVKTADNTRKFKGTVNVTNYNHWLLKGLSDVSYGAAEYATLAPVIAVDDNNAISIAVHEGTGLDGDYTGLAVKEITNADGSKWTSIYSAVPTVPTALIRNMLKRANCHIYDENSSDLIFADSNYVAVHSLFAGERKIDLPGTYTVYDVFNREIIAESVSEFTFTMDGAETRLFRLSEPETVQCYITHNAGGTTSQEGLVTLKPGEDLKFDFEAEDGYSINYLLVDGEKVIPENDSYKFEDIKESHTVIVKFSKTIEEETVKQVLEEKASHIFFVMLVVIMLIAIAITIIMYYKKRKNKQLTGIEERKE